MKPRTSGLLGSVSLLLAAPLAAQTAAVGWVEPYLRAELPTGPVGVDYRDLVTGDFRWNLETDVFVLNDGALHFVAQPAHLQSRHQVATTLGRILSIGKMHVPRAGGVEQDVLLATNASGIHLIEFDPAFQDFEDPRFLRGGLWSGADHLKAVTIDGVPHITARSSDKQVVVSMYHSQGVFRIGDEWTSPDGVLDWAALDYDEDGDTDMAILTERRLLVFAGQGVLLESLPAKGKLGGQLGVLREAGVEYLVWTREQPDGTFTLEVFDQHSGEASLPLVLEARLGGAPRPILPASLAVGDVDGDGFEDVVLTDRASQRAVLLHNLAPDPGAPGPSVPYGSGQGRTSRQRVGTHASHFSTLELGRDHRFLVLGDDTEAPGGGNLGSIGIADTNGDLAPEVLIPVSTGQGLLLFTHDSLTEPGTSRIPTAPTARQLVSDVSTYGERTDAGPTGKLNLAFDFASAPWIPTTYSHVQVVLWKMVDTVDEPRSLPTLISNTLYDFAGKTGLHQWVGVELQHGGQVWPETEPHYFVQFRFVTVDLAASPARILTASPSYCSGMANTDTSGASRIEEFPYLRTVSLDGHGFILRHANTPYVGQKRGNQPTFLGAYYTTVQVPEGDLPILPPPSTSTTDSW